MIVLYFAGIVLAKFVERPPQPATNVKLSYSFSLTLPLPRAIIRASGGGSEVGIVECWDNSGSDLRSAGDSGKPLIAGLLGCLATVFVDGRMIETDKSLDGGAERGNRRMRG
jgi:hypothetical protein